MAKSVGRPPKYNSVVELQAVIDAYFAECDPHVEYKWAEERYKNKNGTYVIRIVKRKLLTEQEPYTMATWQLGWGLAGRG